VAESLTAFGTCGDHVDDVHLRHVPAEQWITISPHAGWLQRDGRLGYDYFVTVFMRQEFPY
jgi:hypothetical protein